VEKGKWLLEGSKSNYLQRKRLGLNLGTICAGDSGLLIRPDREPGVKRSKGSSDKKTRRTDGDVGDREGSTGLKRRGVRGGGKRVVRGDRRRRRLP